MHVANRKFFFSKLYCASAESLLNESTLTCMFGTLDEGRHATAAPEFAALLHSATSSLSDGHRHRRLVARNGCAAHLDAEHCFHVL